MAKDLYARAYWGLIFTLSVIMMVAQAVWNTPNETIKTASYFFGSFGVSYFIFSLIYKRI